jgi:hypothetical protein
MKECWKFRTELRRGENETFYNFLSADNLAFNPDNSFAGGAAKQKDTSR